jgi:dihydrofolate reductase
VLDDDSNQVSLDQLLVADAMVLGRKTYEGLAAVWPTLADDPAMGVMAGRINSMPKYVASRSLQEPLEWNATLLKGDLAESIRAIKDRHGLLFVSGAGALTHDLTALGLVDEYWFWVSPALWPAGPRIFDGVGPVRLELIGSTTFPSGPPRLPAGPRRPGRDRLAPAPTMAPPPQAPSREQPWTGARETSRGPRCGPPTPTASGSWRPSASTTSTAA